MSVFSRLRRASRYRFYSTILSPNSSTRVSTWEESRAVLSLIETEKDPERIIDICRAATLTPEDYYDRISLSAAISKLVKSCHFEGIRQYIEELKIRPDLRNQHFVSLAIIWYAKANMLDHAIHIFKQMDEWGIARSVKSLNALLVACDITQNYDELCRIFLEFPKAYEIEPNLDTYNLAVKAFCLTGSSSSAYSLLGEMDRKSVKPNETTFRGLVTGFYEEEKFEDVGKVLKRMEKSREKSRVVLSLLKTEKDPERISDICRAATLTPEAYLDRISLSIAMSKLFESNHLEGIRQYLEELKTRPDLRNERFVSYAIIWYGKANMLDHAIRRFKQMDELGIARSVKSLNTLLRACVVTNNYKELCRIFLEFPKTYEIEPNLATYNLAVKAFCVTGSFSSVYSLLAEMDRKSVKPNETTFGTLLVGFYKEQKFEDVGKVLKLMEKYDIRPGILIYNIRIQSLCKLKKSSEAKALLDEMMSRRVRPNSVTYCHLIHGFYFEGDFAEANNLFKDMRKRGCKPNSACYLIRIRFLCQAGEFETALFYSKVSISRGRVPDYSTMTRLVNGLVSISMVDDAKDLVKQIKGKFWGNSEKWKEIEAALPR